MIKSKINVKVYLVVRRTPDGGIQLAQTKLGEPMSLHISRTAERLVNAIKKTFQEEE